MQLSSLLVPLTCLINISFAAKYCPKEMKNKLCYTVVRSGSKVTVTMRGPAETGWMALGFGKGMKAADVFIGWKSKSNKSVVSHRVAKGYIPPTAAQDEVGTLKVFKNKVEDAKFQTISFSVDATKIPRAKANSFMWAYATDKPAGDSTSARIHKHDESGLFTLNL